MYQRHPFPTLTEHFQLNPKHVSDRLPLISLAPMRIAVALAAVALILALACGQQGEPASAPAVVDLTPPPPVNTVAPASPTESVSIQAQPQDEPQNSSSDSDATADTGSNAQPAQDVPVQLTAAQVAEAHDEIMSSLYEQTVPSVVGLRVIQPVTVGINMPQGMPDDFFSRASGSGFVWDDEGHVVTNWHVVEAAERIVVVLSDGTLTDAEVIGRDPDSDLAVIKIDDESVRPPPIALGDSDTIKPGQLAVAIGDPFSRGFSMTSGVISALGRTISPSESNFAIPRVIQHDAATNPGNSGGPLLNRNGELVGINAQIISQTGAFSGVGLAIPVNLAKLVVPALISEGHYEYPYIGIRGTSLGPDIATAMGLPPETRGALILAVGTDSAASRGGLRASDRLTVIDGTEFPIGGDVIIDIDGATIRSMDDLLAYVVEHTRPGDTAVFTVLRDGGETTINITMDARPR